MTSEERDGFRLTLISEAIVDLQRRLHNMKEQSFLADRDEQALTAFRLSIVAENANRLSDGVKARYPAIPWKAMAGFRNIVAHEYHLVDAERSWEALATLPVIAAMAEAELSRLRIEGRGPRGE